MIRSHVKSGELFIFAPADWNPGGQRSGGPGDHPDGGLSSPSDVLVQVLAPPLQQAELLLQEAPALRSFSQRGQSPEAVQNQSLPPPLLLLLLVALRQQVQEDGEDVQLQTQTFTCGGGASGHMMKVQVSDLTASSPTCE